MDYYQKYLKYKGKYLAMQQEIQSAGSIADLSGILIPPELQALDDAFLPGFNIDKKYVNELLNAAKVLDRSGLVDYLDDLNEKSKDGLCAEGNRNNKIKKTKSEVKTAINDSSKNAERDDALKRYKEIEAIRMYPVEKLKKSKYATFQAIDDAFLPGVNIDKAYVGHLYNYAKNATNAEDLINKLRTLHAELHHKVIGNIHDNKGGLAGKGDRLTTTQNKSNYNAIKENYEKLSLSSDKKQQEDALTAFKSA